MRFLLGLLILVWFTTPALAGFEGLNGGTSLKIFNRIDCGAGLTCSRAAGGKFNMIAGGSGTFSAITVTGQSTLSGDVIGDGGDQMVGFLQNQVASTTTTITAAQCGSTFVSDSADVLTLPEASTVLGCRLTFVCGTADDFDINPNDGTDTIGITGSITGTNTTTVLAPSAGDALRCTDIGAGFVLEAVGADLWAVLSTNGIITDVN